MDETCRPPPARGPAGHQHVAVVRQGSSTVKTTLHETDLRYTQAELRALFAWAAAADVERGGRYIAHRATISIWSQSWLTEATLHDSSSIGMLYFRWGDHNHLWLIECDERFTLDDLFQELGRLEEQALGRKVHGR